MIFEWHVSKSNCLEELKFGVDYFLHRPCAHQLSSKSQTVRFFPCWLDMVANNYNQTIILTVTADYKLIRTRMSNPYQNNTIALCLLLTTPIYMDLSTSPLTQRKKHFTPVEVLHIIMMKFWKCAPRTKEVSHVWGQNYTCSMEHTSTYEAMCRLLVPSCYWPWWNLLHNDCVSLEIPSETLWYFWYCRSFSTYKQLSHWKKRVRNVKM